MPHGMRKEAGIQTVNRFVLCRSCRDQHPCGACGQEDSDEAHPAQPSPAARVASIFLG